MKLPFLNDKTETTVGDNASNPSTESTAVIEQQTQPLVEKHTRKKRSDAGKPRSIRDTPQVQGQMLDPANALNLELVKKSVAATVSAVDGVVCRKIGSKCQRLQVPVALGQELVANVALTPGEQEIISESTTLIFQRYEFLMRHAPEVMLASVMAAWGLRIVTVTKKLDAIEEAVKAAKKKAEGESSSQPN